MLSTPCVSLAACQHMPIQVGVCHAVRCAQDSAQISHLQEEIENLEIKMCVAEASQEVLEVCPCSVVVVLSVVYLAGVTTTVPNISNCSWRSQVAIG